MRVRTRLFSLAACLCFCALAMPAGAEDVPRTLAVMEFDNRSPTGEWQWLGKGLADMLITDLSASSRLVIVEREKLSELTRELEMGRTGLIDTSTASRVGKLAAVDWVLFGSFLKEGDQLKIEAHLLDLKTQKLLRVEWVEGRAEDVFKLEKQLVRQILERLDVPLTEAERKSIEYVPTDSIPAFEHYSLSLGHFDNGDWHRALLECRLAVRADADFLKAKARLADLYRDLGEPEHALIEYRRLIDADRENVLPESVYYKMGRLLEDTFHDDAAASAAYQRIVARHPEYQVPFDIRDPSTPSRSWDDVGGMRQVEAIAAAHDISLRALERLALILERAGEEFEAAKRNAQIVFFRWRHGMGLETHSPWDAHHRRVWARYSPIYWRVVRENRDTNFYPPISLQLLPPEGGTVGSGTPPTHGFYKWRFAPLWLAPPDKEIAELAISVDCSALESRGEHDFVQVEWTQPGIGIAGGRWGMKKFDIGSGWQTARFELEPGIRHVRVHTFRAPDWKITFTLRSWSGVSPVPAVGRFQVNFYPATPRTVLLDGRKLEGSTKTIFVRRKHILFTSIPVGEHVLEAVWPSGRRASKKFYLRPFASLSFSLSGEEHIISRHILSASGSYTYLYADLNGRLWLFWDQVVGSSFDRSRSEESDLFWSTSTDGMTWTAPKRSPLSSSALDMRPLLQQDGYGTYWLVWYSSRDPDDLKRLWIASSEDGIKWSFPRKVVLPIADRDDVARWNGTSYAFAIDKSNNFWLIWQGRLFHSEDAVQWAEVELLKLGSVPENMRSGNYFLAQDPEGRLLLLADPYVRVDGALRPQIALWQRSMDGIWRQLGVLAQGDRDWAGGVAVESKGLLAVTFKSAGSACFTTGDERRGWSKQVVVEHGAFHPSIAALPDGRYVVAYACKDGIVAAVCEPPSVDAKDKE